MEAPLGKSTKAWHRGGTSRSMEEVSVMEMDRRGCMIQFLSQRKLSVSSGGTQMKETKPFIISRKVIWEAYQSVKANKGASGVDRVDLKEFAKDLKQNLYRIWNQMSSGSYMPSPVLLVEIPKKGGGKRPLGIPTIADRVAQTVVKMELEPILEPIFHPDSYGYRPHKSALDAVGKTRERCWQYDWVLDVDIKGFFDNIPHDLLMKAVRKHSQCRWVLLYIERWLVAPVQNAQGVISPREKGTPQGSVISPLLANLFLHYCTDEWMRINYPNCPFERYADDIVIHLRNEEEANSLKEALGKRMEEYGLSLHPDKTRIVYCKDANRKNSFFSQSFDFLGYTFRPRMVRSKKGQFFVSFSPAISKESKKGIYAKMREWKLNSKTGGDLTNIANFINPVISGWINYYGKFQPSAMRTILNHINYKLAKWAKRKYKRLHGKLTMSFTWLVNIWVREPNLFTHWKVGVKP